MPARVDPCLASLVKRPPSGPDWAFEVKWDGYRLGVHIEHGRVRVLTRGSYDWTERFPSIADDAKRLAVKTAIIDGEAVVLDHQGRSDFGMLQRALGRLPSAHEAGAIVLFAFDLLYLDGHDLQRLPQRERRRLLEPLVAGREGAIRLSEEVDANGDEFLRVACAHGLEGIIAKHREKPYRSGRGDWWQKITCKRRDSFVIIGFVVSAVPGALGRLLLAARKGDGLAYVGGCGTGWSNSLSRELRQLLEGIATKTPAVCLKRKNVVFTEPLLVADVEYRAWTDEGKLRHASFKGLRHIEDQQKVFELPRS